MNVFQRKKEIEFEIQYLDRKICVRRNNYMRKWRLMRKKNMNKLMLVINLILIVKEVQSMSMNILRKNILKVRIWLRYWRIVKKETLWCHDQPNIKLFIYIASIRPRTILSIIYYTNDMHVQIKQQINEWNGEWVSEIKIKNLQHAHS